MEVGFKPKICPLNLWVEKIEKKQYQTNYEVSIQRYASSPVWARVLKAMLA